MKDSEKVLPPVRWAEIREYFLSVEALAALNEGDSLQVARLSAGSRLLRGPEITKDGQFLALVFLCPTDSPVSFEVRLRGKEGREVELLQARIGRTAG